MNVPQLYKYTARFLSTQASYCCTHIRKKPWILGAGINSISIYPERDKRGVYYRVEARILFDESGYELESLERYRIPKYAKTKQKRAL